MPKLGRARSEKKSATCLTAETFQIGRTHILRRSSGRMDWLHHHSSEVGGTCKDFPARRDELPATAYRELAATAVERRGNLGSVSSRRVRDIGEIPCIFPVDQGYGLRDGFATDWFHRHLVCGCRDFAPATRDHPRNSRVFAGSWQRGVSESEPETASSAPIAGSWSRLSLLPSWAVRLRSSFAYECCEFESCLGGRAVSDRGSGADAPRSERRFRTASETSRSIKYFPTLPAPAITIFTSLLRHTRRSPKYPSNHL